MTRLALALFAGLLILTACTATPDDPAPTSEPTAPATTAAAQDVTAAELRGTGTALTVGGLTVQYRVTDGAVPGQTSDEDGATTLELATDSDEDVLLLAAPEGWTAEALSDGGVLLRDPAGVAAAGIDADGAQPTVAADGLIGYRATVPPATVRLTLATVAVRSATWADLDDEGGRSLAVVPSTWARGGGLVVDALLWAQLVAAQPEADSQGMHDQLTCHQIGAPEKESWNLEPWRPDVGLVQAMLARCNPS